MSEQRAWPPLGPRQTWRTAADGWKAPAPPAGLASDEERGADRRRQVGAAGEQRAAAYLAELGYRIVERNWRNGFGELDLIAMDGPDLVVVEVRTLASPYHGCPEESVGPRKQRQLAHLAAAYVQQARYVGEWRIDVVAIDRDGLRHVKNAVSLW